MPESQVRIFVSSPSDVDHERALVKDVIEQLGQEYLPYFRLQAVLWEEEALSAARSFQAGLLRPAECDIVLVMAWTRLGTPLADDPYGGMTGTEWEFLDAVEASARQGRPEVLVYKKTTPRLVDITNAEATREALEDQHRLETFFRAHFFNPDGSFRRAFRQFDSDRVLRELVEGQLRKLLNRRISAERGALAGSGDWRDSPFRAEAPYERTDEPVFVGREVETRELVARLDALKGAGRGLILVTGPSGVGKSSLIRAGLLPRLARPFLFPGVSGCRWCLIDFDGAGRAAAPEPLETLARTLTGAGTLGPALAAFGLDADRLVRLLARDPEVAAEQVRAAVTQVGSDTAADGGAEGRTQLALILDSLDGLFSESALEAPGTQSFAAAVAALAACDGIWVIATLRGDHLRQLPRLPALATAVDGHGWFPIDPPPAARIRQVLEIPARVAGIDYESGAGAAGHGLVELLEAEAATLPHWPALLELTLDRLFANAVQRGPSDINGNVGREAARGPGGPTRQLTVAAYQSLGGIAGSTLSRADALWAQQTPTTRAALPVLCRALIALEGGPNARPSPRLGDLRTLRRDPGCASLIQSLIDARLVVAEGIPDPAARQPCAPTQRRLLDALTHIARETREEWRARLFSEPSADSLTGGEPAASDAAAAQGRQSGESPAAEPAAADWRDFRPVASLAHPALMERWGPMRDWLADPENRRDLRLRFQITRQARLWKRTDCNREYLLGEVGYAEARRFADAHASELEPLEQEYLEHSQANLLFQRRRNRAVRLVGLTLAALLAVATGAALWAWTASRQATLNLHRSQLNAADLSIGQGNTPEAVRLALDAGPYLPHSATDTLSRAFTSNRLIAMIQGEGAAPAQPLAPAFRDDGEQIVTLSARDGAQLWDLREHRFLSGGRLAGPELPIHAVRFAGRGERTLILGIGAEGVWRLPAEPGAAPDWSCGSAPNEAIALDAGRRYLALAHPAREGRTGVCLLDLRRPGKPLWDRPVHRGEVRGLAFAPDGMTLVTAAREGSAHLIDTITGFERLTLPPQGPLDRPLNSAVFDSKGERVALACTDERVRVYGLDGRLIADLGEIKEDGRTIRVHKTTVRDAVFSADGRYLLAGDDEGQLVRWDLNTGTAEVLGQHRLSVEHVQVSSTTDPREGEPLVLTASVDRTARLWGLLTGKEVAVFSHDAAVSNARFSTDYRRVLTYSDLDGSARLWGVEPTPGLAFRLPHENHVWHLDLAPAPRSLDPDPDVLLLATGSFDGLVRVWRYDRKAPWVAPAEIWRLAGHRGRVRRVSFSPSARLLASAAYDGSARVWDMVTGGGCALEPDQPPEHPPDKAPPAIDHALFSADERWLLTAGEGPDQPVRLWDPATCVELPLPPALEHGPSDVQAAAVARAPDGADLVATGNAVGTLRLARRERDGSWTRLCRLQIAWVPVTYLAFAPDGGTLAAADENGHATLVNIGEQCGEPRILDGGTTALYSVGFSPDGKSLVTASLDGRAQVWDTSGRQLVDLVGHKDRVYYAEFSPDGGWLLTASRDGAVRLWERPPSPASQAQSATTTPETQGTATEIPVQSSYLVLEGELGGVPYARFSPDGHSIAAAYWESAAVLWRLWTEDPAPDPALEATWGKDRARLALIREAARFRRDNRLDARSPSAPAD